MRSIVYHQFRKELHIINFVRSCISSSRQKCTPKGVMRYKCDLSHLMIYTLLRDDIPSLSAWIKKLSFFWTRVFWCRWPDSNRHAVASGGFWVHYVYHSITPAVIFPMVISKRAAEKSEVHFGGPSKNCLIFNSRKALRCNHFRLQPPSVTN